MSFSNALGLLLKLVFFKYENLLPFTSEFLKKADFALIPIEEKIFAHCFAKLLIC